MLGGHCRVRARRVFSSVSRRRHVAFVWVVGEFAQAGESIFCTFFLSELVVRILACPYKQLWPVLTEVSRAALASG